MKEQQQQQQQKHTKSVLNIINLAYKYHYLELKQDVR